MRGRDKVASFVVSAVRQDTPGLDVQLRVLNGQPAMVVSHAGRPFAVIMLAVDAGMIRSVFLQADAQRMSRLGDVA